MRFLIDTQLPTTLADLLIGRGYSAEHVLALRMGQSSDKDIWDYACAHQAIIVTKDEDFLEWKRRNPNGASVLWIRLGNCPNNILFESLISMLPGIVDRFQQGEGLIEIR